MAVKYIGAGEFRRLGFLQEANRLFFHPHGLALELTTVTDEQGGDGFTSVGLLDPERATLMGVIDAERSRRGADTDMADLDALAHRIDEGTRCRPGDKWVSGVWDYRDDPEGVTFGSGGYGDSHERAERVRIERLKHAKARAELFHGAGPGLDELGFSGIERHSLDIEPLDWTYPADASA
jgi:hypothetical protein